MSNFSLALPRPPQAPQFNYPQSNAGSGSGLGSGAGAGPSKVKGREGDGNGNGNGNEGDVEKPLRPPQRVNVGVPEITAVQGLVPTLQ